MRSTLWARILLSTRTTLLPINYVNAHPALHICYSGDTKHMENCFSWLFALVTYFVIRNNSSSAQNLEDGTIYTAEFFRWHIQSNFEAKLENPGARLNVIWELLTLLHYHLSCITNSEGVRKFYPSIIEVSLKFRGDIDSGTVNLTHFGPLS